VTGLVRINTPGYTICITPGLIHSVGDIARQTAPAHRYAIITDSNVAPLYAQQVATQFPTGTSHTFVVPAGETHKNRETWASLTDQLFASHFTRDSTIIALGGGVIGDLAGFVAATFMRGIPFIQVPTTLLAMIDASIGGKTGVDTLSGKNLVGAFHPPAAVTIDPEVLETLELSHWRGGLAEAVKHGAIADEEYFLSLDETDSRLLRPSIERRDRAFRDQLIVRSVQIKSDVVARDEREQGVRKVLNFGHTIGHAVELLSGFTLSHGEAVAIGMVLESTAAERLGVAEPGTTARIINLVQRIGLPTIRPGGPSADALLDIMRGDKKARGGAIEYAVPAKIGTMAGAESGYAVRLDDTTVRAVLA
jgi:3-dehydroquinate synthase